MSKEDPEYALVGEAVATPIVSAAAPTPTVQGRQVVETVAPNDLEEGYRLPVQVDGCVVMVIVPLGGAKSGERFLGQVVDPLADMDIPRGNWRDGFCDCCSRSCTYCSLNCLAFWCLPVALAQVMTRMQLDWFGGYRGVAGGTKTFNTVVIIFFIFLAIDQTLVYIYAHLMEKRFSEFLANENEIKVIEEPTSAFIIHSIDSGIRLLFGLYILIAMSRTRGYIRQKYGISEKCCRGSEDCCLSFLCGCCTVTQMARHTADYERINPACCTEDGLPAVRPTIV